MQFPFAQMTLLYIVLLTLSLQLAIQKFMHFNALQDAHTNIKLALMKIKHNLCNSLDAKIQITVTYIFPIFRVTECQYLCIWLHEKLTLKHHIVNHKL